jgi:hypothetical protein
MQRQLTKMGTPAALSKESSPNSTIHYAYESDLKRQLSNSNDRVNNLKMGLTKDWKKQATNA